MSARARAGVAWLAFIAWLAWLGWQAVTAGRFPVVSRAQFLSVDFAVLAEVKADEHGRAHPKIQVVEIIWPQPSHDRDGQELTVPNLPSCEGFGGTGRYIVPLSQEASGGVRLASAPLSPLAPPNPRPAIYPDVAAVRGQLKEIRPALR